MLIGQRRLVRTDGVLQSLQQRRAVVDAERVRRLTKCDGNHDDSLAGQRAGFEPVTSGGHRRVSERFASVRETLSLPLSVRYWTMPLKMVLLGCGGELWVA